MPPNLTFTSPPLRHRTTLYLVLNPTLQELETQHLANKGQYDAAMAQYESRVAAIETEVCVHCCTTLFSSTHHPCILT